MYNRALVVALFGDIFPRYAYAFVSLEKGKRKVFTYFSEKNINNFDAPTKTQSSRNSVSKFMFKCSLRVFIELCVLR